MAKLKRLRKLKIVCCIYCGRDTTGKRGICGSCQGGKGKLDWGEVKIREVLPPVDDPMDYEDDYSEDSFP